MDPENGWQAPDLAAAHAHEGHELARDMAEELGPDYRVELELWELGEGYGQAPNRAVGRP